MFRRNQGIVHLGNDHEGRGKAGSTACALDLKSQNVESSSTPSPEFLQGQGKRVAQPSPWCHAVACVPMLQVLKKDRIPPETDIQRPRSFFARSECVNCHFSSWFGDRQESGLYDTLDTGCFMSVFGNIRICHFSPCNMCQNSITLFHLDTRTMEEYRILSVKTVKKTRYF